MNPAMTLVRVNLATALVRTGHPDEAKATLEKVLELRAASRPRVLETGTAEDYPPAWG